MRIARSESPIAEVDEGERIPDRDGRNTK